MTEAVVAQRNTVSAEGFVNPLTLAANAEEASHIKVYGDDVLLTLGVDYTLDGVGDVGGLDEIPGVEATIDNAVLLADVYSTFTIEHDPPADQDTDFGTGTLQRLFTAGLDAVMRRVQSIKQLFVDRALTLPVDAVDVNVTLPHPEDRRALVWAQDQDTGEWSLVNSYSDPDTEPLTNAEAAAAAAQLAETNAEAAAATATAQALLAADAADRAEIAAGEAGDLTALLNFLWPVGALMDFAGAAAPANFLACNGAAVSRATYSALFAVIGTTYGAGDGSTTFNLPTFNDGRFRRSTGGNAAAQGVLQAQLVGTHGHTASTAAGGAHTHTYGPKQGVYGANNDPYGSSDFRPSVGDSSGSTTTLTTSSNGAHTHGVTVDDHTAAENRPANSSVLVCIKY